MLRHVVMFKLKDPGNADELARRLRQMEGRVEPLRSIEIGINVVQDARAWDLVLLADFDSTEQLERYRQDPVHLEVLDYIKTVLDQAATVDYWLEDTT